MYKNNLWRAILALFNSRSLLTLLLNIDRLGNAIAGGNYRATISARVGYFAMHKKSRYWMLLEKVINETFRPLDGPNHCRKAYSVEKGQYRRSSDVALAALSLLTLVGCLLLIPLVWLYATITGAQKKRA